MEIGKKELQNKKLTLFIRDTRKKEGINIKDLAKLKKYGEEFDKRLILKADKFMKNKIVKCKGKEEIKKTINNKQIAKIDFCSIDKEGEKCAAYIEKEVGAEIRGVMANKKEKPSGKCAICNKSAKEVVYLGKSY